VRNSKLGNKAKRRCGAFEASVVCEIKITYLLMAVLCPGKAASVGSEVGDAEDDRKRRRADRGGRR